ncbi:MAG: metal-dependent hydrolase [Dictyoglomaceae bacterium]
MTSKTHQSFSFVTAQIFYPNFIKKIFQNQIYWSIGFVLGVVWGTLIPDIDSPHSQFSKRLLSQNTLIDFLSLFIISLLGIKIFSSINRSNLFYFLFSVFIGFNFLKVFLKKFFKRYFVHRGFLHSIWSLIILNILLVIPENNFDHFPSLVFSSYNGIVWGINIGYLSHLLGDAFTFSGIRPFFPFNLKISFNLFRTNSFTETILFYFFNIVNILLLLRFLIIGG